MEHQIEEFFDLNPSALDPNHYFETLLAEGIRTGAIGEGEAERIQKETLALLTTEIRRYTRAESLSLRMETAQIIGESIFFAVGLILKRSATPGAALKRLITDSTEELFGAGLKLVQREVKFSGLLLKAVQKSLPKSATRACRDTVWRGIPLFFREYEPEFAGAQIPGSIDYQLSRDISDRAGIMYIRAYLETLLLENRFCLSFEPASVAFLLRGVDEAYDELMENLFQTLLVSALGCVFAGIDPGGLSLTDHERRKIFALLHGQDVAALAETLEAACKELVERIELKGDAAAYARSASREFAFPLFQAMRAENLEAFFFTGAKENPKIDWETGACMSDDAFRKLIARLQKLSSEEKASQIRNTVKSLTDLVDLLDSQCLEEEDYPCLFASLGDFELALLCKNLPADPMNPRGGRAWQLAFQGYYQMLSAKQQNRIQTFAGKIRE